MLSEKMITERPPLQQPSNHLEITYYTDPLCCWSWAFEPQWRRFVYEFQDIIRYRYCMAGLLPSWEKYHDEANNVSRPIQMGPVWMHAQQLSGMPIQHTIWMKDAPASSYPACMAVKAVELQSIKLGERYLRMLREAVMIQGRNIAKRHVLVEVAVEMGKLYKDFDTTLFEKDLQSDTALESFKKDVYETRQLNIVRFPSLVVKNAHNQAILLSAHSNYESLLESLRKITTIPNQRKKIDPQAYKNFWHELTEKEAQQIIY